MPITNNSKITPISAKTLSAAISESMPTALEDSAVPVSGRNDVQSGDYGPINIPAKRYPMIRGCLILKNARVTIPARIIITA